jgi:hypothetical protein
MSAVSTAGGRSITVARMAALDFSAYGAEVEARKQAPMPRAARPWSALSEASTAMVRLSSS